MDDFSQRLRILCDGYDQCAQWAVELNKLIIACSINQSNCINEQHRADEIRFSSINILYNIARKGGIATQTELTESLSLSKQALTLAVNMLEDRGFVHRFQFMEDRRRKGIRLTEDGLCFLVSAQKNRVLYFEAFCNTFSESEAREAIDLLQRINEFYKEYMAQF